MSRFQLFRKVNAGIHQTWMLVALIIMILIPFIIGAGLLIKSEAILKSNSIAELLFSSNWKPLSGQFGFWSFIVSSVWVTILALLFSAPFCILTAIHLTQYTRKYLLKFMHPVIDILAGIPSVVFGVWGILVIVPFVSNNIAPIFGISTSGFSILSGAIVLAVMSIPFILNILIEIFNQIPAELMEASYSLGATKWQTIKKVLLRKAFPGITAALGLGVSRAFGETIAVLMVVGNVVKTPHSAFDSGYPIPALIANNYGEMMSIPLYDSALMFAALILFAVIILFNLLSRLLIVKAEYHL